MIATVDYHDGQGPMEYTMNPLDLVEAYAEGCIDLMTFRNELRELNCSPNDVKQFELEAYHASL